MRVVLVTPGFLPDQGGVETHTGRLATELAALGVDVRVLTARRGPGGVRREIRDGVPVQVFPAWRTTAMSISPRLVLAGLLAHRDADVVHVHSYHAACGFAALSGAVAPVVFTPHFHGGGHTGAAVALHRVYGLVGRALFRSARAVICVSRAERDAVVEAFPSTADRTHVVPNGVDAAALAVAVPLDGEPPTVLSVGRLEPYKRVDVLVRAWPELAVRAQLVIVGQGSQRAELEELSRELGVADRVRFLGAVDDETLHRWMRTAQVLVSLSAHEAFGMVPVEAASAGARIVLSDIPAHREITADFLGAAARVVPAEPVAVAAAVAAQLAEPDRIEVEVPDWGRIAASILQIYRSVMPGAEKAIMANVRKEGPRTRRVGLLDRSWVGMHSVLAVTPLDGVSIDRMRAALLEHMRRQPAAAISCRLDEQAGRWVPVPERDRRAHVARVLVPVADPDPDRIDEHITAHLAAAAPDLPFVAFVGPTSVTAVVAHAVGDAVTSLRLVAALARADGALLSAIEPRTGPAVVVRALASQLGTHRSAWMAHFRQPTGPPVPGSGPFTGESRPGFAGTVLDNAAVRDITRWRNKNRPGVSITAVLTTAAFRALRSQGLSIHDGGFYALVDIRGYLPDVDGHRFGNLAKSLYLGADLDDPNAVAAALAAAQDSRRALPALVAGAAITALRRPALDQPSPVGGPVMLTFNSLPSIPGMADLPWSAAGMRRYYGFGASSGPGGITMFSLRMRDHLQMTASFDEASTPGDAVRKALDSLSDIPALLSL